MYLETRKSKGPSERFFKNFFLLSGSVFFEVVWGRPTRHLKAETAYFLNPKLFWPVEYSTPLGVMQSSFVGTFGPFWKAFKARFFSFGGTRGPKTCFKHLQIAPQTSKGIFWRCPTIHVNIYAKTRENIFYSGKNPFFFEFSWIYLHISWGSSENAFLRLQHYL